MTFERVAHLLQALVISEISLMLELNIGCILDPGLNIPVYFNTFGGNPVSMAVACSVLEVLEDESLQENARVVGAYMKRKLESLKGTHQVIGDVRGVGLLIGVEFVKDRETKLPATEEARIIKERLANEFKILCLTDGKDNNVLKIKPPMCITNEDVDYFVMCLDATISDL